MKHTHKWKINYIPSAGGVDHATGLLCECGKFLSLDRIKGDMNEKAGKKSSRWLAYLIGTLWFLAGAAFMAHFI